MQVAKKNALSGAVSVGAFLLVLLEKIEKIGGVTAFLLGGGRKKATRLALLPLLVRGRLEEADHGDRCLPGEKEPLAHGDGDPVLFVVLFHRFTPFLSVFARWARDIPNFVFSVNFGKIHRLSVDKPFLL